MNWKFACAKWEVGFTFPEVKLDRKTLSEVANHTELIMCAQRLTSWSSIRGGGVRVTLELPFFLYFSISKRDLWRGRGMRSLHTVNLSSSNRSQGLKSHHSTHSKNQSAAARPTATLQNGYGRGCCVWSTGSASCHGWAWAPFQRRPPSSAAWAWSGRFGSCPCSPCSYGRLAPADRKKWAKCAGDAIVGSLSAHLHGWAARPPDTAVSTDRRCQCQFHQHRVTWLTQSSSATNYTTQGLIS